MFGDKDDGFSTQHELIGGANWYFANTRNIRVNGPATPRSIYVANIVEV